MSDLVQSVEALDLLPSTIVVVRVLGHVSPEELAHVRAEAQSLLLNNQVIVATTDVEIRTAKQPAEWSISFQAIEQADPTALRTLLLDLARDGVSRFEITGVPA